MRRKIIGSVVFVLTLWSAATCRGHRRVESTDDLVGAKPPKTKAATSRRTPRVDLAPVLA